MPPKQRYVKNYFPVSYVHTKHNTYIINTKINRSINSAANKPVTTECTLIDTTRIMIIPLFIKHDLLLFLK